MLKPLLRLAAAAMIAALPFQITTAQETAPDPNPAQINYGDDHTVRSLVFKQGDFGSKFYRIPAIAALPDGTIVAVADKRIESNGDLPGKIDVVARRSTDGGRTWSPYITVAEHNDDGGYGDPALVYDRRSGDLLVISTHGNGLWQQTPGQISLSRSRDGGLTWEKPVNLNPQILRKKGLNPNSMFASSGAATQLKDGRLMFVLVTRTEGHGGFPCYAVYSDDGGRTWQVSNNAATLDGDESKTVQLSDGSLIMSIRNRYKGPRVFSRSTDRGTTWSAPYNVDGLPDPACNGDILHYTAAGRDLLLQSLPDSPDQRENIAIYVSKDGGKSWPRKYRVLDGPAAYSAMTILPDGSIGMLSEEATHDANPNHSQGYRIWFTKVPIEDILGE